jgi:hypothetical protein
MRNVVSDNGSSGHLTNKRDYLKQKDIGRTAIEKTVTQETINKRQSYHLLTFQSTKVKDKLQRNKSFCKRQTGAEKYGLLQSLTRQRVSQPSFP